MMMLKSAVSTSLPRGLFARACRAAFSTEDVCPLVVPVELVRSTKPRAVLCEQCSIRDLTDNLLETFAFCYKDLRYLMTKWYVLLVHHIHALSILCRFTHLRSGQPSGIHPSLSLSLFSLPGYIGKKHLAAAMETVLKDPLPSAPRPLAFAVVRVPFFLEPDYDENAAHVESNRQRLIQKWGGTEGWERQKKQHDLKGRGRQAGIPHFNLDRLAANTMASHRLIQYLGKTYGLAVSETVYDCLNVYYFVDGHSLNDRPRLAATVAEKLATLNLEDEPPTANQLLDFLNGNQGRKEIEKSIQTLHQLGIHGIPKFIIEGQTVIDGAAHARVFEQVFREIEARGEIANGSIFGDILGISPQVVQRGSHVAPTSLSQSSVA